MKEAENAILRIMCLNVFKSKIYIPFKYRMIMANIVTIYNPMFL